MLDNPSVIVYNLCGYEKSIQIPLPNRSEGIDARIAMIAITTSNSIRVKNRFFIIFSIFYERRFCRRSAVVIIFCNRQLGLIMNLVHACLLTGDDIDSILSSMLYIMAQRYIFVKSYFEKRVKIFYFRLPALND